MFALLALAFTACESGGNENEEPNNQKPVLTCTSNSPMEFSAEGGQGKITYTLKNANTSTALTITENADWIEDAIPSKAGEITFTVKANTGDARATTILVSYDTSSFSVKVKQAAGSGDNNDPEPTPNPGDYEVEMTLPNAFGEYYGTEYSDAYNYYLILSDSELDEEGYMLTNSTYYFLDIYSSQAPANSSKIQVPVGTYTYDASDSAAAGTIGAYYSSYAVTDNENVNESFFASATLEVKSNGTIELTATLESGETHHITFSGDYSLNGSDSGDNGGGSDEGYYSNLTGDYSLDLNGTVGYAEWYGDYYEVGLGNWYVILEKEDETGDTLVLDLLKEGLTYTGDPTGTYTAAISTLSSTCFVPGYLEEYEGEEYFMGCWMVNYDTYYMTPLANGTITITKSGNNYTITANCTDDSPEANTVSGSWTGSLSTSDKSQSYSVASRSTKARKATKVSPKRQLSKQHFGLLK